MAKAAYYQKGEALDYVNSTGNKIDANTVIVLGTNARIGVAGTDIANGATGSVHVVGVFELPKTSSNAITQGTPVYWDGDGATEDDTDNTPAGYAAADASASATTILVKIG